MKLTEPEKSVLQWAIKKARSTLVEDPNDPYKNLMLRELLDVCESEVDALEPDDDKYVGT